MGRERKKRSTGVVTHAEHAGAQQSSGWDALRADAIGSLWGRTVAEPDGQRTHMSR